MAKVNLCPLCGGIVDRYGELRGTMECRRCGSVVRFRLLERKNDIASAHQKLFLLSEDYGLEFICYDREPKED